MLEKRVKRAKWVTNTEKQEELIQMGTRTGKRDGGGVGLKKQNGREKRETKLCKQEIGKDLKGRVWGWRNKNN